jgi:DNA-binding NarL/FixJ family response regulator
MSSPAGRTAVIADPHPLWLDAMQLLLERLDIVVVGCAADRELAIELLDEHSPDVLVGDDSLLLDRPAGCGPSAIEHARQANPEIKCVILSEHADAADRQHAFAAGASVFCAKWAQPDDLAVAVRQAFEHSIYFARNAERDGAPPLETPSPQSNVVCLTKREIEILCLAAEGHSNSQLARMLWVTEQTVKFHLSNIYRKLDVSNRTEASRWAQRHGMLGQQPAAAA